MKNAPPINNVSAPGKSITGSKDSTGNKMKTDETLDLMFDQAEMSPRQGPHVKKFGNVGGLRNDPMRFSGSSAGNLTGITDGIRANEESKFWDAGAMNDMFSQPK